MATNKFLTGLTSDTLATESTLSELNDYLQSGALNVSGINNVTIDNFPATQNVNATIVTNPVNSYITNDSTNDTGASGTHLYTMNNHLLNLDNASGSTNANLINISSYTQSTSLDTAYFKINGIVANAGTNLNTSLLAKDTTLTSMSSKLPSLLGPQLKADSLSITLSSDEPILDTNIANIDGLAVTVDTGSTTANTMRIVLTDDFNSKVLTKSPSQALSHRRSAFYFDSSVTGGAINHNLAYDLTTSAASAPILSSLSMLGTATRYIHSLNIYLRPPSGSLNNTNWGNSTGSLATGFGLYYITFSGGAEIPLINSGTATNELPSQAITNNSRLFKFADHWELFDPGASTASVKFIRTFDPPIEVSSTGSIYFKFAKEDITGGGSLTMFEAYVNYYA